MPRPKKEPKPSESSPTMYAIMNDFTIDMKVEELRRTIKLLEARIEELLGKKRGLKPDDDVIGRPSEPL